MGVLPPVPARRPAASSAAATGQKAPRARQPNKIKARYVLYERKTSWREVDGCPPHDVLESAVLDGRLDPVPRLLHRRVGQSHNDHRWLTPPRVDFDFDGIRFDAQDRCRMDFGKHAASL